MPRSLGGISAVSPGASHARRDVVNIVECHFEFAGFDDHLVKGGISVYTWNLSRCFVAAGHSVRGVTAGHGLLDELRTRYEVEDLDWSDELDIPVPLDPRVWPGFPDQVRIAARVTAHRFHVAGITVDVLVGGPLDMHTDSFYPPYELKGRDLTFLKPLVFQVAASRFLRDTAAPGTVIHLHEPYYHYVMPAALAGRGLTVVSTVQANMPVNKKVYGPEVRALVEYLGGDPSVTNDLEDPLLDAPAQRLMRGFLPSTMLYYEYPERPGHDYVSLLALVLRSADLMDFLSPGQLEHVVTQADTPFEDLFHQLTVCRELRQAANRLVVGGCAIGDAWLHQPRSAERRERTLTGLGLDPALPTLYHNARYAVHHKGQREMFRALLELLDGGERANVLLHCLAPRPPEDPDLLRLAERHPDLVRVRTDPMAEDMLIEWAVASDLCLFPSKFEMDTFLVAMGEAMACGAVPIATRQRGTAHFRHSFDLDDPAATGLALPRSFRIDDPVLVQAIKTGVARMLELVRSDAERMAVLRSRAVAVARDFTWERVANRFIAIFTACAAGEPHPHGAESVERPARAPNASLRDIARVEAVLPHPTPGHPPEVVPVRLDSRVTAAIARTGAGELGVLVTLRDGGSSWRWVSARDLGDSLDA
jgi:glycosyltransferase AcbS